MRWSRADSAGEGGREDGAREGGEMRKREREEWLVDGG